MICGATGDRRMGKVVNFAVIYGMGPKSLSQDLDIPMKQARDFIAKYQAR
jgi:DNA polymerase I